VTELGIDTKTRRLEITVRGFVSSFVDLGKPSVCTGGEPETKFLHFSTMDYRTSRVKQVEEIKVAASAHPVNHIVVLEDARPVPAGELATLI
jgi:hypothetical protein